MWWLISAGLVWGAGDFSALKDKATRVANLGRFLEQYVGACDQVDEPDERRRCESERRAFRAAHRGKLHWIDLGALPDGCEQVRWNADKTEVECIYVPFFSERGYGLSLERPRRLHRGAPVVGLAGIKLRKPADEPSFGFERTIRSGRFGVELAFVPGRVWALGRGTSKVEGLAVKLRALRAYGLRDGATLGGQRGRR